MHDFLTQGLASIEATAQDGEVGSVIKNPRRSPASFDSAKKRWNVKPTRAQGTAVMTISTKKAKNVVPETCYYLCG